jgi:phosphoglycerate dehydrogenase-like enzyme
VTPLAVYTDVVEVDPAPGIRLLEEAGFAVRVVGSPDPEVIARAAPDAAALLIGYTRVDGALLDALPGVGLVATQSVGFDMVDLDAARERGVWVSNVPAAATEEVAVHALAMALSLLRGLPFLDRAVREGRWQADALPLRRPSDTTLGILGLGRIGRRLAGLAQGTFGRVIGHDPVLGADAWPEGVERADLDTVLRESDVTSLHLPLSAETERLIDAAALARMRPGAHIVNVSRGALIDDAALLEALDRGQLGGAALDVLEREPPDPADPLLRHPRVLLTPHAAYYSDRAARAYVTDQARNAVAWLRDGRPGDVVVAGSLSSTSSRRPR